jgi:hypothetical protein
MEIRFQPEVNRIRTTVGRGALGAWMRFGVPLFITIDPGPGIFPPFEALDSAV